eukprot:jgi/Tetstr1/436451/TSEL_025279.t1
MKVVEKAHKETQAQLGSGGLINSMKAVGYFEEEGRLRYNPEPLFTDQIRDFNPRGTLSHRHDADGAAAQQNRANREERLQKSFWNNRRESEVALEVCRSMYKSNLPSGSSTGRRSGGRSLNAQGVVFTSALHLSFLQGTTELKELEGGLEHAKAALKDAKAARKHSRHVFITLSLRRIINRLLVTAYLAGPDALRAARRCRSILARAAAKSANRTFSTMGACGSWLLEGLRS